MVEIGIVVAATVLVVGLIITLILANREEKKIEREVATAKRKVETDREAARRRDSEFRASQSTATLRKTSNREKRAERIDEYDDPADFIPGFIATQQVYLAEDDIVTERNAPSTYEVPSREDYVSPTYDSGSSSSYSSSSDSSYSSGSDSSSSSYDSGSY